MVHLGELSTDKQNTVHCYKPIGKPGFGSGRRLFEIVGNCSILIPDQVCRSGIEQTDGNMYRKKATNVHVRTCSQRKVRETCAAICEDRKNRYPTHSNLGSHDFIKKQIDLSLHA